MAVRMLLLAIPSLVFLFAPATGLCEPVGQRLIVKLAQKVHPTGVLTYSHRLNALFQEKQVALEAPLFHEKDLQKSLSVSDEAAFPYERYRIIILSETANADSVLELLAALPGVEYAEFDYPIELYGRPNDPGLANEWGLENTGQEYLGIWRKGGNYNDELILKRGTPGADLHVAVTWDDSAPRSKPLVAIVDTGLDTDHPDIIDNLWSNPGEIADNGLDDDHNGYIDDVYGWDFSGDEAAIGQIIVGDNDVSDSVGHGTHCAGIIGATSNNGIGIAGVCSEVQVVGLKIFPNALMSVAAKAILYATEIGAEVMNMSWGSPYRSTILLEALEYARSSGVLPVAAAGNFASDMSTFPGVFPVSFTVSATNSDDEVTYFSSFGDWIDIAAPGRDILSLRAAGTDMYAEQGEPNVRIIDEYYYLADGTSMSAPHVCGAAAVLLSYAPGTSPDRLQEIIEQSADDLVYPYGDTDSAFIGWDRYSGHGRVNVEAALATLNGVRAKITLPYSRQIVKSDLEVVGCAYSESPETYQLDLSPTANQEDWETVASGQANIVDGGLGTLSVLGRAGDFTLRLSIGDMVVAYRRFVIASDRFIAIDSPAQDETVSWFLTVRGSVLDPEFESYKVFIGANEPGSGAPQMVPVEQENGPLDDPVIIHGEDDLLKPEERDVDPDTTDPGADPDSLPDSWDLVYESSRIVADSVLCGVSLGGYRSGVYTVRVTCYTQDDEFHSYVRIRIEDRLFSGFPQMAPLGGNMHFAPTAYNVDGVGDQEVIFSSRKGVTVVASDGEPFCCNWPNLWNVDCYSAPAVFDINQDSLAEIALITDGKLEVFDCYGVPLDGFPKRNVTGYLASSYPTPLLADIDSDGQYEILWIGDNGHVFAYRANGMSYFASLDGRYANTRDGYFAGSIVPFLFCVDLEGDGELEVIAGFPTSGSDGRIYVWNARNGQARQESGISIANLGKIRGGCVADFDQDGTYDIAVVGRTFTDTVFAAVMDGYGNFLPGWPRIFSDRWQYLVNYPAAGDIDGDGFPDLVFTISSLDNGEIYVLGHDGTPYRPSVSEDGSYFAKIDGTLGCVVLGDVSGDGLVDIVVRTGSVFPGVGLERIFALDREGEVCDGWPIYTFTPRTRVFSTVHTPVLTNIDNDGYTDLVCSADDSQLYIWNLNVPYEPDNIPWGQFLHDSRNSGILPGRGRAREVSEPARSAQLPSAFSLSQNYPNPFNPTTIIDFAIVRPVHVNLDIYNILGRKVRTLIDGPMEAGKHSVIWDGRDGQGRDVASGIYFYRIVAGASSQSRKMVKLK